MKRLFTILICLLLFTSTFLLSSNKSVDSEYHVQSNMMWVTEWVASDNLQPDYGRGKFFYRLSRSAYPDKTGIYRYDIHFLSDSYYNYHMYGNVTPHRSATKIDAMTLYVNNRYHINILTNTETFWLVFKGDFDRGIGEVRVSFVHRDPNANVFLQWSEVKPF